mmetsp:Transcript_20834/g.58258  ORF Transcript_20834/g.58258 Transcript_20834/m.58258 type:complete len:354 (-) Transcript_20834:107-1168(-)
MASPHVCISAEELRVAEGASPSSKGGIWSKQITGEPCVSDEHGDYDIEDSDDEEIDSPVLQSFDLDCIVKYIQEQDIKKIVVMCGAGISTSAGVPDFRSRETGLYDNSQRFDLPEPECNFTLDSFNNNPEPFYELCRDMWPGNYKPTACHHFLRLLHDKGLLSRCYTENIDSLEQLAGLPAEKLVAVQGNFDGAHVVDDLYLSDEIKYEADVDELREALNVPGSAGWEALRKKYGGLVKPNIVLSGENLPERFFQMHKADLRDCDLLFVFGTSLIVQPFASLLEYAPASVPRLLINHDPSGKEEDLPGGFRFHHPSNYRDVWHRGDCDSGVEKLARKLGWAADLHDLMKAGGD